MWGYRITNGLWSLVPVVLAIWALRPVTDREADRFAARYRISFSLKTSQLLIRSLRRNQTGRLAGAALGFTLPPVAAVTGHPVPGPALLYGIAGYFLGAFLIALVPISAHSTERRAFFVPRQLSDYLPRLALIVPGVAIVCSAMAVMIADIEPHRAHSGVSGSQGGLLVSAVASIATLAAVRMVVHRAQPASRTEDVTIDDALRTATVHTLTGAGISVASLGTTLCLLEMGGEAAPAWLHWVGLIASLFSLTGVIVAWQFRGSSWFVSRAGTQ